MQGLTARCLLGCLHVDKAPRSGSVYAKGTEAPASCCRLLERHGEASRSSRSDARASHPGQSVHAGSSQCARLQLGQARMEKVPHAGSIYALATDAPGKLLLAGSTQWPVLPWWTRAQAPPSAS